MLLHWICRVNVAAGIKLTVVEQSPRNGVQQTVVAAFPVKGEWENIHVVSSQISKSSGSHDKQNRL